MYLLAVDLQGHKDLLGIYISDAESARFWLSVLTDLQTRGVKDLLICSIDNLSGFGDAIETVFPQLDLADRKVIGWALSDNLKAVDTSVAAWRMALNNRRIEGELLFHRSGDPV